ncbi:MULTISPECIES: hypothetical protein [Lysinibacillus]|uniref:Uncharacterized protein n=1 Tax=Lysinibacillus antri TaxID=2498145 RepID=A0A3S0WEN4_9BACI|nr:MULTISPECIES: hypothetical protein [Lysinibacillus]RUL48650.1 hypothetical protein EK386_16935 [Lysinibacillus antri]TSI09692.1 hypothetical protein FJQ64_04760 [Lysinibacillus sp. BW-2-10]
MSRSDAKKKRLKLQKQQGKDVANSRGKVDFSTHQRVTKTKLETLEKMNKKYKKQHHNEE